MIDSNPARALALLLAAGVALAQDRGEPSDERPPNIVVIFIDDLGYADIGPFGAEPDLTPNLNRLAEQGMRLTDFQTSTAVCSASRAALLTGCYHRRVGIAGALGPRSKTGIADEETTLAELCKQRGYATACFGKWHLGHHPRFLPLRHGFDEYFGLPYSNDMWPLHPDYARFPPGTEERKRGYPNLPLVEGEEVVDAEVTAEDQAQLTRWYTEHAVDFVERNAERPFLLYVPHSMVHVPLYVSERFAGKSGRGLFADVVMEVDWSVGEIVGAIERHELAAHTLVLFTSDNGPWLSYGEHAGSAGPLREGKGTLFEGGTRVSTIAWWPGRVPAGATCGELASTLDVLPTVAALIGAELPGHRIDGQDIRPLLFGEPGARSPHDVLYRYYAGGELQAVRDRRWKLHFPHRYATLAGRPGGRGGTPAKYERHEIGLALFDLENDVGETTDVAAEHPEIVVRLQQAAARAREDLGDKLAGVEGKGVRPAGQLGPEDPQLVW